MNVVGVVLLVVGSIASFRYRREILHRDPARTLKHVSQDGEVLVYEPTLAWPEAAILRALSDIEALPVCDEVVA